LVNRERSAQNRECGEEQYLNSQDQIRIKGKARKSAKTNGLVNREENTKQGIWSTIISQLPT